MFIRTPRASRNSPSPQAIGVSQAFHHPWQEHSIISTTLDRKPQDATTEPPCDERIAHDERLSRRLRSLEAAERERTERARAAELAKLRELQTLD